MAQTGRFEPKQYYGRKRVLEDGEEEYQLLMDHLCGTAKLAGEYASAFTGEKMGKLLGLLHDVGKFKEAFQEHLKKGDTARVDHSSAGAFIAMDLAKQFGMPYYALLSYAIASHHSGLLNYGSSQYEGACLYHRLEKSRLETEEFDIWNKEVIDLPLLEKSDIQLKAGEYEKNLKPEEIISQKKTSFGFSLALYTRFLFSCLVDADRTDAGAYVGEDRKRKSATLLELQSMFDVCMKQFTGEQMEKSRLNEIRAQILQECLVAAEGTTGIYSLSVPTGGGKTYASMGFALQHGIRNGCRRIVYALPFTSIIEQNAEEYRKVFGSENVLESHSNYENPFLKDEDLSRRMHLSAEDWDMPIIVTTNVQLFETLFSDKPSKLRKLHNLSKSVLVLDEAQAIPNEYVKPCMAALEELVRNYGCSVVLCTATQPGFDQNKVFLNSVKVQEIISEGETIAKEMKRVDAAYIGVKSVEEIAAVIKENRQILTIVNTKRHAQELFFLCKEGCDAVFHLSTNMYPNHRRRIIKEIKAKLEAGMPCRVISTQLIEAGVNLDFPLVYRSLCGVDSVIQAAGRCNREGRLPKRGKMFVFEPEKEYRGRGYLGLTAELGKSIMQGKKDILSKEVSDFYFKNLFDIQKNKLDQAEVMVDCRNAMDGMSAQTPWPRFEFEDMARKFKLIEESGTAVVIPKEPEAIALLKQAEYAENLGGIRRKLAQYTVNVRDNVLRELEKLGAIKMQSDCFFVLWDTGYYDESMGLKTITNDCFNYIV